MVLKVFKPNRDHDTFLSLVRDYPFRDQLTVLGKIKGTLLFLNSSLNNPFRNYEAVSIPVPSGTYKLRVASEDSRGNLNTPGTDPEAFGTIAVLSFTLPPRNIEFTVSGNNITFTWDDPQTGNPDSYVFYGAQDVNEIDRTTPLDLISGTLNTNVLTLADGNWKVVIEAIVGGVESENLFTSEFSLPDTAQRPPRPGIPATTDPNNAIDDSNPFVRIGLELTNVSVGKVRIRFYWLWGIFATSFKVYHNNGSGLVNFGAAAFTFTRVDGLIQSFTTTQLNFESAEKTFIFVLRAVNANGLDDGNIEEYTIVVKGIPPDLIEDFALDTVL